MIELLLTKDDVKKVSSDPCYWGSDVICEQLSTDWLTMRAEINRLETELAALRAGAELPTAKTTAKPEPICPECGSILEQYLDDPPRFICPNRYRH